MARDLLASTKPRDLLAGQSSPAITKAPSDRRAEVVRELSIAQPQGDISRIQPLVDELQQIDQFRSSTRAAQQLPEISEVGVSRMIPDADAQTQALVSTALVSATNPQEIAQILSSASPDIGLSQDEAGNLLVANNRTGQQAIINRPGLSPTDVVQTTGRIAAFTPSGRLSGIAAPVAGAVATEGVLQGVEAAAGGEFNPEALATEGATTAAGLGLGKLFNYGKLTNRQRNIIRELEENPRNPDLAKFTVVEGKPEVNKALKEAVRQFGSPETIAVAKAANPSDKKAIKQMVRIIQKGKKDPLFSDRNRVGDVVGDSLKKRINAIRGLAGSAGKQIDKVARTQLRGKNVDVSGAKQQFKQALDDLRVNYNPQTGAVSFEGSALEGAGGSQARDLVKRMAIRLRGDAIDASDAHFAKRLIDQKTAFGTSDSGLSGEIDRAIKGLRANINQSLRDEFPDYARANQKYADAVTAIDDFQGAAGSKLNLDNIEALGTKARSFTNNSAARARLIESLDNMQSTLNRYGVRFKDDVLTQVNVANALEERFKTQGSTALKSEISKGARDVFTKGVRETALERGAEALERVRGVSDEKALESLINILGE